MSIFKRSKADKRDQGIIVANFEGGGLLNKGDRYTAIIEVEKIESLGDFTKVKILSISGVPARFYKETIQIIGNLIPTKDIQWIKEEE